MRHKVAGYKLGRNTAHRRSLLRNLVTSVIVEERIETTVPKAKAARPIVEKLNRQITQVLKRPAIRDRMIGFGLELVASTADEFQRFRAVDFANWGQIVKKTSARFEP